MLESSVYFLQEHNKVRKTPIFLAYAESEKLEDLPKVKELTVKKIPEFRLIFKSLYYQNFPF